MALVLCTGTDETLMQTRRMILERAGHKVVLAHTLKEVEQACEKTNFDVVVIGQAIIVPEKQRIAELVRRACRDAKILELHRPGYQTRAVHDADDWLEVPIAVPAELATRVSALAKEES
jgi:DNA-binding response OmpR family regulator